MVETLQEFLDEVRTIKQEIYATGENADVKMIASWLDRLLISLEKVVPTLELMAVELAEVTEVIDRIQEKKKVKPAKKGKKKEEKKRRKK
ncbi:MAG: hypothetical protein QXT45_01155 [Candidatus Bilamarchaeaceae archaeon]